jgi:hypothetical protein
MVYFCVMVKGPCRGKLCDFWARIKIRKSSLDDLVKGLTNSIAQCADRQEIELKDAFNNYWFLLGIRSRSKLCKEEPDLCEKMRVAEERASRGLVVARQ